MKTDYLFLFIKCKVYIFLSLLDSMGSLKKSLTELDYQVRFFAEIIVHLNGGSRIRKPPLTLCRPKTSRNRRPPGLSLKVRSTQIHLKPRHMLNDHIILFLLP